MAARRTPPGAYGIKAVDPRTPTALVCGSCGRAWLEDVTPAARCPWEDLHRYPKTRTLTGIDSLSGPEVLELQRFIAHFGPRWKSSLRDLWVRSVNTTPWEGVYRLRNSHGPSWLTRVTTRQILPGGRAEGVH